MRRNEFYFVAVSVAAASLALLMPAPVAGAAGEAGGKLDVGTEIHYFNYEEPDIMEENGWMFGVYGKYAYRFLQNQKVEKLTDLFSGSSTLNTVALEAKFSAGEVDYDSSGTGSADGISDFLTEVRLIAGYDLPVGQTNLVMPYLGLGYRYWLDELGGKRSTTGHFGYDRESHYLYLPLGVDVTVPGSDGWSFGGNIEFDVFLDGQQKSHLEDVSPLLSTLDNDQNEGYGIRGSLRLARNLGAIDVLIEPFIRYWSVENSDLGVVTCGGTPCALGYEPKNRTIESGVRIGARF